LFISDCSPGSAVLSVPQFHVSMLVAGFVCGVFRGFRVEWVCMGLGIVKLGMECRHFRASIVMFSGRYGNFCCSDSKFGRSIVMNEYNAFCMLSDGLVMCGFYE
jgi:hypothetical protein